MVLFRSMKKVTAEDMHRAMKSALKSAMSEALYGMRSCTKDASPNGESSKSSSPSAGITRN